jgi:methyl-accepting chemotaxis protein
MKWFYNLKIKTKLLTGFILVACVVGIVGFVGITNIKTLDESDTELYENITMPITEAADMGMAFQRLRINIRDMISANDPQDIQEQADKIAERRAEISTLAESFEAADNLDKVFAFLDGVLKK